MSTFASRLGSNLARNCCSLAWWGFRYFFHSRKLMSKCPGFLSPPTDLFFPRCHYFFLRLQESSSRSLPRSHFLRLFVREARSQFLQIARLWLSLFRLFRLFPLVLVLFVL